VHHGAVHVPVLVVLGALYNRGLLHLPSCRR